MSEENEFVNEENFVWDGNIERADICRRFRHEAEEKGDLEKAQYWDEQEALYLE